MAASRTAVAVGLALVVTVLAALELFVVPQSSPILLTFSPTHGLHVSDLGALAVWAAVMVGCWRIAARGRSRRTSGPTD